MKWKATDDKWKRKFAWFPVAYTEHDTYPATHWIWWEWYEENAHNPPYFRNKRFRLVKKAK